jgi:hypothetical protein
MMTAPNKTDGERESFEAHYAKVWTGAMGSKRTENDVRDLRVSDGYGGRSHLNGMWEGWQARAALASQAGQRVSDAEIAVHVGNLPTLNQDEYPALGDWWVQLWDGTGDDAKVLARVYGDSPQQAHERAGNFARALLQSASSGGAEAMPAEMDAATLDSVCHAIEFIGAAHYLDGSKSLADIARAAYNAIRARATPVAAQSVTPSERGGWIPFGASFPEDGAKVFIYGYDKSDKQKAMHVAYAECWDGQFTVDDWPYVVSHWMPSEFQLPVPPMPPVTQPPSACDDGKGVA